MKHMNILFVGNSHTYYNDMPKIASDIFAASGIEARVTMLTEGGKNLLYHYDRKDVKFDIIYGNYDYVVLQEVASSFDHDDFIAGVKGFIEKSLSKSETKPILYMIWPNKGKSRQNYITESYVEGAKLLNCPIAPAGEVWRSLHRSNSAIELYREDGNHATPLGSYIAAACIFYAITQRVRPISIGGEAEPHTRLGIDDDMAKKVHKVSCAYAKKFRA